MFAAVVLLAGAALAPAGANDIAQAPRASRHALIIGVGEYLDPAIPELKGIAHDVESAMQMAAAMQIPKENIRMLRDREATGAAIEHEIAALNKRTRPGDRVFFYFSGHGSRWYDAKASENGCIEALLPSDAMALSNARIAALLKPIADKTDKLFVFYDACHSGGIVSQPMTTMRSMKGATGTLTPKFSSAGTADQCTRPANMKSRSFTAEAVGNGALAQNIVQISSSRPDEVSFDDEDSGGLATQAWRDCMLGESKDLDHSGSISVAELAQCAQKKIDTRFANSSLFAAQHITLGGNQAFIPSWFSSEFSSAAAPAAGADAVFADIMAQRDPRRTVTLTTASATLRIGKDLLDLSLRSSHAGHVYLLLLGSDQHSFYVLFPNDKDRNNAINAGETLRLPRPDWKIMAQGPAGANRMLAIVTAAPRDLSLLGADRAGPFLHTLTDERGRARLGWILGNAAEQASSDCKSGAASAARSCSDVFGAASMSIIEE